MKRKIFLILVALLVCGSISAQQQKYTFNTHDYKYNMLIVAQIKINGVEQISNSIELGAFCVKNGQSSTRGSHRIEPITQGADTYYRAWIQVYSNSYSDTFTFKIWNHETNSEMDNCSVVVEFDDGIQGTNTNPIVINFVTIQTFTKPIIGYDPDPNVKDRYYLIASPIGTVSPENVQNMINSNGYDLYYFDQTKERNGSTTRATKIQTILVDSTLYPAKATSMPTAKMLP